MQSTSANLTKANEDPLFPLLMEVVKIGRNLTGQVNLFQNEIEKLSKDYQSIKQTSLVLNSKILELTVRVNQFKAFAPLVQAQVQAQAQVNDLVNQTRQDGNYLANKPIDRLVVPDTQLSEDEAMSPSIITPRKSKHNGDANIINAGNDEAMSPSILTPRKSKHNGDANITHAGNDEPLQADMNNTNDEQENNEEMAVDDHLIQDSEDNNENLTITKIANLCQNNNRLYFNLFVKFF